MAGNCHLVKMLLKPIKDCITDEYGKDYDLSNVTAFVGFFNGIGLYDLHVLTMHAAQFDLTAYAVGYAALIGAIVGCQKLKPRPIVPDISKE